MADILICGMDMPGRCEDCILCHQYETVTAVACGCKVNMRTRELDCVTRPDWCPLIEVPPHGPLIDAEAFLEDVTQSEIMRDGFKEVFAMWIGTQEIVIPAEPPKEEN